MVIRFIIEGIIAVALIVGLFFEEKVAIWERKKALQICTYFINKGGKHKCLRKIKKKIEESNERHGLDITQE